MKFIFIVSRLNHNKWFAPLIQEGLSRALDIECWIDHRDMSLSTKWYEFPSVEKLPSYNGNPKIKVFHSVEELKDWAQFTPKAVIFTLAKLGFEKIEGQIWVHIVTSFFDSLFWIRPTDLDRFDYIFCNTDYWAENCLRYYELCGYLEKTDPLWKKLHAKFLPMGSPLYDHFKLCSSEHFLQEISLPEKSTVITLYAFEGMISFWFQRIFLVPSILKRLFYVATLPFSYTHMISRVGLRKILLMFFRSFRDRILYLSEAVTSKSELDVLLAIKKFCKKNNYTLVFKYRKKNPQKRHQKNIADREIFEDTQYFPYSSAEVICSSKLIVTFFSSAVAEAVFAGVPVINLIPPKCKFFVREQYDLLFPWPAQKLGLAEETIFYNNEIFGIFHYPGAVWSMTVNEFVKKLPHLSLDGFKVDPRAQKEYIEKFISPKFDGKSAGRIFDFLINQLA